MIANKGDFRIQRDGDLKMRRLFGLLKENPEKTLIKDDQHDRLIAIGRINGPSWLYITDYPISNIKSAASEAIFYIFAIGLLSLAVEIFMMWSDTSRMQAEGELRSLNERLEETIALRTRQLESVIMELKSFSYSVSHDLRAPLRVIDGFSQVLAEEYRYRLDERGIGFLRRITESVSKMGILIEALLSLSRVSHREIAFDRVDISAMSQDTLKELKATFPDKIVEINVEKGIIIRSDRALTNSIFSNLLENAWKYTSQNPYAQISVSSIQHPKGILVVIKDNGVGFDNKFAEKLFQPFQRLHPESQFKGTGIGLALVKRAIERLGGTITATGSPGNGAKFEVFFPDNTSPQAGEIK